ncbi:MAG: 50S ribosomal protein L1 [candidate division WS6 bacterium OLB20]|uniref:Large ribosomal subunit protein uL1 n=1 Tax=candidate division WS6 bacterium OLB20 TaxID=1617426 RepID=A0A136LYC9_9BACT|nr:MAG: 50S ribosomal protein L1 [candidate division WS6 bacterium OLB20]
MKRSKKYLVAAKKLDAGKKYTVAEAAKLLPQVNTSEFAGTVELSVRFRLTDKQKKESVRGTYTLPNRFGKDVKVLLFADPSYDAKNSKADIVGGEELIADVEAGKISFDMVVAMPGMMPKIARLGRTLGSKGLMPNPKNGTVTEDPDAAVEKLKSGQRNYKLDDAGRILAVVATTDMAPEKIEENVRAFAQIIAPEISKFGAHSIKKVTLSPTMGPSIDLNTADFVG